MEINGHKVVSVNGAFERPYMATLQALLAGTCTVDVHFYGMGGHSNHYSPAMPVDGFIRGLLGLQNGGAGLDGVVPTIAGDIVDLWQQQVLGCAGVVFVVTAGIVLFGNAGTKVDADPNQDVQNDDPYYALSTEGEPAQLVALGPGEMIGYGLLPVNVRASIKRRNDALSGAILATITDVAPNAAAASEKVWATNSLYRKQVTIQAYASPVYAKLTIAGAADPSASSTNFTYPIPAGSSFSFPLGPGMDVWVQSAGNYSAQETL